MALWHCFDRFSGDRFEVHGSDEESIGKAIEAYIMEGIDGDDGEVGYDVQATAIDGSEYIFTGTIGQGDRQ